MAVIDNAQDIGNLILFHRKQSGLTQAQLAEYAGLGKTVIYDIEKGKQTIKLSTLFKIATILNMTMNITSPLIESTGYEKS
jgi:HTH-type transcriptional regulator / antitoxin HipB